MISEDLTLYIAVIFTALHVMQTRYCDENSVRPSVRHTRVLWQNGRKICSDLYTIRKNIYLTFVRRRIVGGGRPLLPEIFGQPTPHWNEIADFQPIIARSASAVTPSKKSSINGNRKSYMGFRLVPNSVTLNDLERRNGTWSALPIN